MVEEQQSQSVMGPTATLATDKLKITTQETYKTKADVRRTIKLANFVCQ